MPSKASAKAAELIEVGKAAPAFTLKDQDQNAHRLSAYKGQWVVLYFYPRDNTPGCTTQACNFRDHSDALADRGAVVLGVSPDDGASHQRFINKHKLNFPLLVDPDQEVAQKYGVWQLKNMMGKKYMGIVRTTYLINPKGKVARRWDKVKVAGHINEVIAAIAEHE